MLHRGDSGGADPFPSYSVGFRPGPAVQSLTSSSLFRFSFPNAVFLLALFSGGASSTTLFAPLCAPGLPCWLLFTRLRSTAFGCERTFPLVLNVPFAVIHHGPSDLPPPGDATLALFPPTAPSSSSPPLARSSSPTTSSGAVSADLSFPVVFVKLHSALGGFLSSFAFQILPPALFGSSCLAL